MSSQENIRSILDEFERNIKEQIIETISPAVYQLETRIAEVLHENVRLKFELDDYKAIVSELRIYEICWNKFDKLSKSTEPTPIPRIPLDELAKLAVFKTD